MFDDAYICDCIIETTLKEINYCDVGLIRYVYLVMTLERFSLIQSCHGGL